MTRNEVGELAIKSIDNHKCTILELSTGFGKSKQAIDMLNHYCDEVFKEDGSPTSVLLIVAKRVHKQNWMNEITKWGGIKTDYLIIECYESFKNYKNQYFDLVIFDELQHVNTEKRLNVLKSMHIGKIIGLSATITWELKEWFRQSYNTNIISCSLQNAIDNKVLPEPKIYLLPLHLDSKEYNYKTTKFKKVLITTQLGYYRNLSSLIDWYKKKFMVSGGNERIKKLWLSTAGKRLKWLSEQKEGIVLNLLHKYNRQRTLTFCSSIEQSERLGKYNITSKNKQSEEYLNMFNNKKIDHITACQMLNEGANLTDCRIGIFCNLNASEIISKQRVGRLLRHKKPVIIIPYYVNTREEELVDKMLSEYNKNLIYKIKNYDEIEL